MNGRGGMLRRPAPAAVDACCVADAVAKAEGKSGCGCGLQEAPEKVARGKRVTMADGETADGAIWALGATQIIGYGTLYYSYSMLVAGHRAATSAGRSNGCSAASRLALLAGGLAAPISGKLADRWAPAT